MDPNLDHLDDLDDDGGDLIISGGEIHPVEEVATTNITGADMNQFLKEHADKVRSEKAAEEEKESELQSSSEDSIEEQLDEPSDAAPGEEDQSAATAASLALDGDGVVQDVPYASVRERLLADGQILDWGGEP